MHIHIWRFREKWLKTEFLLSFKHPFSVIDLVDLWRKKNHKKSRNQVINLLFFVHVYKYSFCNNIIKTKKVENPTLATLSPYLPAAWKLLDTWHNPPFSKSKSSDKSILRRRHNITYVILICWHHSFCKQNQNPNTVIATLGISLTKSGNLSRYNWPARISKALIIQHCQEVDLDVALCYDKQEEW